MAIATLTNTKNRADFFYHTILVNLRYWQGWVPDKMVDVAALDRERNNIVRSISFAIDIKEVWPSVRELIVTFSPYMERRGYWDAWNWVLNRAIEVARNLDDIEGVANLSALLARLLRRQSRFRESTIHYRQAIRLSRQIGDHFNEARACTNLGYYYIDHGYWRRAEALCCHALTLFEQLESDHGRAHTENHLGVLYTEQCLWDKAERHFERAYALWNSMGDNHGLMQGYSNLGKLFYDMGRADEALLYLEKSFEQAKQTGDELGMGVIYMNIGIVQCRLKGELAEAETHLWQAEAIFRRFSITSRLAQLHEYLGVLYTARRNWSKALLYLETALENWRNLGNRYSEIRTMISIVEYELAKGNQQRANVWLMDTEYLLGQYDPPGRYCQLHQHVDRVRRSLAE